MISRIGAALAVVAALNSAASAQGPVQRAGQALDNAGRNIRRGVESAVARGQITAEERDVLHRVSRRLEWDKQLTAAALQLEARPGGAMVLRGSVPDAAVKQRAVDLVENTIGVTSVVDELAVVKEVRVIEARPPAAVEVLPPVTVPAESKVIVKP